MNDPELLSKARQGDSSALGKLLDQHREPLRGTAERDLGQRLQRRVDASDIVQQTFLIAHQAFQQFRGTTDAEFQAWLRTILNQNVQEAVRRHVHALQRSVTNEVSLESAGLADRPINPRSPEATPSQRIMRRESSAELQTLLAELPDDQREAVRLKHLEGQTLAEIAAVMNKSEAAVAGFLRRGITALKQRVRVDS
jgi:RNA polymerase sigma-70 factor (ECF subfamily)